MSLRTTPLEMNRTWDRTCRYHICSYVSALYLAHLAIAKCYFKAAHFIAKIYSNVICGKDYVMYSYIQLNSIKALNRLNQKLCKQRVQLIELIELISRPWHLLQLNLASVVVSNYYESWYGIKLSFYYIYPVLSFYRRFNYLSTILIILSL